MRRFVSIALVFAGALAFAQDAPETYGKTDAQVLAMDLNKWEAFYSKNAGPSTATTSQAYEIYGQIAKKRNDKMPHAARVTHLRTLMQRFGDKSVDIGENITGGGTMWNPVRANAYADVELALYPVLGGKAARAKPTTVARAKRAIAKLHSVIEKNHADKSADSYFHYDDARKDLAALRTDFASIVKEARSLSRANSDHVLQYCITWAGIAVGN